jgi:hypothetical protein
MESDCKVIGVLFVRVTQHSQNFAEMAPRFLLAMQCLQQARPAVRTAVDPPIDGQPGKIQTIIPCRYFTV